MTAPTFELHMLYIDATDVRNHLHVEGGDLQLRSQRV